MKLAGVEVGEPRLMRVMLHRNYEYPDGDRTVQRWVADDFRAGTHRTREGARQAWRRKVLATGRP